MPTDSHRYAPVAYDTTPHPWAERLCAEALSWVGTPFHDQACVKGVGVDCVNFLLGVGQALGLIDRTYRPPPYHPAWHLSDSSERLYTTAVAMGARPIAPAVASPGDILFFRFRGWPSHGHCALLLPDDEIVHALTAKRVLRQRFSPAWQRYASLAAQYPLPPGGPMTGYLNLPTDKSGGFRTARRRASRGPFQARRKDV
jgi:NlpC/P60 family putative phage cell wall peptidase